MTTRLLSLAASTALALGALSATGISPARAASVCEPVATDGLPPCADYLVNDMVTPMQNPSARLVGAAFFGFSRLDGTAPAVPVQVTTSVTSCGNPLQTTTSTIDSRVTALAVVFTPENDPSRSDILIENSINRMVGPSIEYTHTISVPGYDPYVLTGSYSGYSVRRPSCEVINSPGYADDGTPEALVIEKWSAKKGASTARVGKSVRITPTLAVGAKVVYRWKAGSRTVGWSRSLFVRPALRGTSISVRVTVSKAGARSQSRVIRFGRAR